MGSINRHYILGIFLAYLLKIAQILNPREERKVETIEIMVWWHKPLAPPQPLLEIWQRQQAGFPCHETLNHMLVVALDSWVSVSAGGHPAFVLRMS